MTWKTTCTQKFWSRKIFWSANLHFFPQNGNFGGLQSWRFETKRRSVSQQKPVDWSRRVLAIDGMFFELRSLFNPVMMLQRSSFGKVLRKYEIFSTFRVNIGKAMSDTGTKLSRACFSENFLLVGMHFVAPVWALSLRIGRKANGYVCQPA